MNDLDRTVIRFGIRSTVIHEVLHNLWHNKFRIEKAPPTLPNLLYEGYIEFRSQLIEHQREEYKDDQKFLSQRQGVGYPDEVTAVSTLPSSSGPRSRQGMSF